MDSEIFWQVRHDPKKCLNFGGDSNSLMNSKSFRPLYNRMQRSMISSEFRIVSTQCITYTYWWKFQHCCMLPFAQGSCIRQVAAPFSAKVWELWLLPVVLLFATSAVRRHHKPTGVLHRASASTITPGQSLQSLQWHSSTSPLAARSYGMEAGPADWSMCDCVEAKSPSQPSLCRNAVDHYFLWYKNNNYNNN